MAWPLVWSPGLTPRSVFEKLAIIAMVDVHLLTTDGREVILSRFTQPEAALLHLCKELTATEIIFAGTNLRHVFHPVGATLLPRGQEA